MLLLKIVDLSKGRMVNWMSFARVFIPQIPNHGSSSNWLALLAANLFSDKI